MKEENTWIKFYQQSPEDGQNVELQFLDGSIEPMKWSRAKTWNPEFEDLPMNWRPLLNNEQNVQECDATAAQSIDSPLAPKNPLEDITECYVVADSPTNMRVEEYADDLVNGFPFPLKSRYVKRITLPSPAVIQETKKLRCDCNSLAEKEFCQSYNYGKNGECAKDLGIDVYNQKNKI
jgi:hypothetical protein